MSDMMSTTYWKISCNGWFMGIPAMDYVNPYIPWIGSRFPNLSSIHQLGMPFTSHSQSLQALGLLSKLFVCPSKGARVCAGEKGWQNSLWLPWQPCDLLSVKSSMNWEVSIAMFDDHWETKPQTLAASQKKNQVFAWSILQTKFSIAPPQRVVFLELLIPFSRTSSSSFGEVH